MMGDNELTPGEKDTNQTINSTTVITTDSGKAESKEETTVYVNDLDILNTVLLF